MSGEIQILTDVAGLQERLAQARANGDRVGLVPTMGALHAGHVSLAKRCNSECRFSVATIFVNPTQFAAGEDLEKYPKTLAEDCRQLQAAGVDVVFAPSTEIMYPNGCSTAVQPPDIAQLLEGEFRPTHFQGVCTIVLKLFNLVQPDRAFFGQKDFQQVAVIRKMVMDLNVPVEIISCPTVRDRDGLALSSRNVYLDSRERKIALSLSKTLKRVRELIGSGQRDTYELMTEMRQQLIDAGVDQIDYVSIADPLTLQVPSIVDGPVVALIAAHVGTTRLIDNCLID